MLNAALLSFLLRGNINLLVEGPKMRLWPREVTVRGAVGGGVPNQGICALRKGTDHPATHLDNSRPRALALLPRINIRRYGHQTPN